MTQQVYKPSGILIEVLGKYDDGEYYMVKSSTSGKVFFAHSDQVVAKEDTVSTPDADSSPKRGRRRKAVKDPVVIKPQKPVDDRINLNTLTAEGLTQVLPGVGIKTAKEIVELKTTLPGERFTKLEQLKEVKRIDWDEVFATGEVYVE